MPAPLPPRCAGPAAAAACSATAPRSAAATLPRRWPPGGRRFSITRSSSTGCCVDNRAIAQVLGEIADLLEIKGDNAFKVRAYRSASETIAAYPDAVARVDDAQFREFPV